MSYERSPRAVCSTTMGTRLRFWIGSMAMLVALRLIRLVVLGWFSANRSCWKPMKIAIRAEFVLPGHSYLVVTCFRGRAHEGRPRRLLSLIQRM